MPNIHCERFSVEQFVSVRQIRGLYSVYVATRAERSQHAGNGCLVSDLVAGGESKPLKIKDLLKRSFRYMNGKKVKASALRGGVTYIMQGAPEQVGYGVFIVPRGNRYTYLYNGEQLSPGVCLLWDGKRTHLVGWAQFRKMFAMQPNPVSAGQMKGSRQVQTTIPQGFIQPSSTDPRSAGTTKPQQVGSIGFDAALHGLDPNAPAPVQRPQTQQQHLMAVGRLYRQNELVGLAVTDGTQMRHIPLAHCISLAQQCRIKNVKAVSREGSATFLMGNGISLESLPHTQV